MLMSWPSNSLPVSRDHVSAMCVCSTSHSHRLPTSRYLYTCYLVQSLLQMAMKVSFGESQGRYNTERLRATAAYEQALCHYGGIKLIVRLNELTINDRLSLKLPPHAGRPYHTSRVLCPSAVCSPWGKVQISQCLQGRLWDSPDPSVVNWHRLLADVPVSAKRRAVRRQ